MAGAQLQQRYKEVVKPKLQKELAIGNVMAIPKLDKIVVNMGLGKAVTTGGDAKNRIDEAQRELSTITGQKPVITKARLSISNFKLREGMNIGMKVTLRGQRMYDFLERLINLAIPRIRDFRGLPTNSFDGRGNYNFGVTEQTIFPEIDLNKVKFAQGMNITICTTAQKDEHARRLLEEFGFPFARPGKDNAPGAKSDKQAK